MDSLPSLDLKFLKQMYDKFRGTSEENIKIHVVTKFLEMVGYNPLEFYYEHPKYHKDGRADIAIKIDELNYLYVEVKTSDKKLGEKEQNQLAEYLFQRNLSWGILTNGKSFLLFNKDINGVPNPNRKENNLDRIVFDIDIFNKRDRELIKYFSKENIFDNGITNYFKDIAQFKALKFPDATSSWAPYKGTLFKFFKYYAERQRRYIELEHIRVFEFEEFLHHEWKATPSNGKSITSVETFINKYSHIRSFFQTLKVKSNGFDEEKMELIKRFNVKVENNQDIEILTNSNVEMILAFYNNRNRDTLRNKAVFLLCLCYGLERSTLMSLTYDSINKDKLTIGDRVLTLPPKIKEVLDELIKENKSKKIKGEHLFYTKYKNNYKPISASGINNIFDILSRIDSTDSDLSKLSPAYVRSYIIKELFKNNYPLEEVMYLTGADFSSISNVISYNEIVEQVKTRRQKYKKVHPFNEFLY